MKSILYILFALLLINPVYLSGQINISGCIKDVKNNNGVSDINVMLQTKDGKGLYSYTITDINGKYSLNYLGNSDSLRIAVAGLNIKAVYIVIPARSRQNMDINVQYEALKIKEVVVKSSPAKRNSDTISYYVSSYIDSIDRSIGDVLKKMPGIDVAQSGQINYNGTPIGKFYIEGMDMLGGAYGIATNNVRARDIAAVQVMEFHQPVKALKKIKISEMTAINLKLKERAKGTFNATFLLGGGYKPAMWQGEVTAMYFARKFQTLNTYKTNNTGEDVSKEMGNLYGGTSSLNAITGIRQPGTPPLAKERYLNNNIHAVSLNAIRKLKDNLELILNGKYYHDSQNSESSSVTTYYLPDESPLVIVEQTEANMNIHSTNFDAEIKSNTDNNYLQEKINFTGKWNNDYGRVNDINQKFSVPKISVNNIFQYVKPFNFTTLEFKSDIGFYNLPSRLIVSPCIYPQIFGLPQDSKINAGQVVNSRRFNTRNSIWAAKNISNWVFTMFAAVNASLDWMDSSLSSKDGVKSDSQLYTVPDSLTNNLYWRNMNIQAGPGVSYKPRESVEISLYPFMEYMNIHAEDRVKGGITNLNKFTFNPSLSINAKLTNDLKLTARGAFNESYGGLYDTYSGYIMTDYRVISSKDGKLAHYKYQNYYVDFNYGNPLISIFGSLKASYWRNNSNLMYGTKFIGSLSRVESFSIDNLAQGYNINGSFSKRFDGIATTFTLSGGYSNTYRDILREDKILNTQYGRTDLGLEVISRFGENVRFDYGITYYRNSNTIENSNEKLKPIDALKQNCTFNITFVKNGIIKLLGEHYFNNSVQSGDKSMFFADISISYRAKRIEYILEGRNLLNTKMYNSSIYNDITAYEYNYGLRPLSVIFKIKFSLR
ncbi:MAG: hypothetical protein RR555_06905 [Bacteroidales bacterium]